MHWSPLPIPWYIQFPYACPPAHPPTLPTLHPAPLHRFVDQVLPLLKAQRLLAALTLLHTQQSGGSSPCASVLVSALRSLGAAELMRDAESIASGLGVQLVRLVWKCGISAVSVGAAELMRDAEVIASGLGVQLVRIVWKYGTSRAVSVGIAELTYVGRNGRISHRLGVRVRLMEVYARPHGAEVWNRCSACVVWI